MRVFRPTYTIPRPKGAKILDRADGKYAKFKTARGEEIVAKLAKSGKRVAMETTHYHIEFRDHRDVLRRLKGFTDEDSSQRVARTVEDLLNVKGSSGHIDNDLQRRVEGLPTTMRSQLAEWGLLDERGNMIARPLTELIELYIDNLRAAERDPRYVTRTRNDLLQVCQACGFRFFSDIDADVLGTYLRRRREAGISYRRSNALLIAHKCFCNWAVGSDFVAKSPLRGSRVKLLDSAKDRRRIRRALEIDELRRLFATTAASEVVHHGLTGAERAMIYRLAAESGMRRGELTKLTVAALDFEGRTITLSAGITKSGRERAIPLTPRTAVELRQYTLSKLPSARVFKMPWDTSRMLQEDLKAAGIEYKNDQGHVFDFHSLRGECATLLIDAGVEPKVAQEILGHSDIRLTLQTYARVLKAKSKKHAAIDAIGMQIDKAG